jgi:hypothetical protein
MKTKITRNLTNLTTRNLFLTGQIFFEYTTYFTSGALVLGVLQKLEYNYQIITTEGYWIIKLV